LLAGHFNSTAFHTLIESMKTSLAEAEARNRVRWPDAAPRNDSYDDEVEHLEHWLDERLTWIKANLGTLP
jgi:CotH kinase protein